LNVDNPPLSTLLSQTLVAFTIEFDNEFEQRMPHRTTLGGGRGGPWLVSMAMWSNLMQYVGEDGVEVGELQKMARTERLLLTGMERWGYITFESKRVRATENGRKAQEIWRPLFGEIEARWQDRFGKDAIDGLRESLSVLARQVDFGLPDYLPVLGYGMAAEIPPQSGVVRPNVTLPALLSKVLHSFAIDLERESEVSLAISANVLRLLNEPVSVPDLPRLSGVSKEAIKTAVGFLAKRGYVVAAGQPKLVRLTASGRGAQTVYRERLATVEETWQKKFDIRAVRRSLMKLLSEPNVLMRGLEPYPDGWRASVPRPDTPPHYPVVLHRGGYPDGS
jgi:hypothetical protein